MPDQSCPKGLPLSFAQEQLWFLDLLSPGETGYNVQMNYRLRGPLDEAALRRSLTWLVARHEVLRATFREADGTPFQVIEPPAEVELTVVDRTGLTPEERAATVRADLGAVAGTPFDLAAGPLHRFTLVRLADDDHGLGLGFHHIVVDGWSVGIIGGELAAAYESFRTGAEPDLPAPALTYRDFVADQRERGAQEARELDFWAERLAGLPELSLPTDRPRTPASGLVAGDVVRDHAADFHRDLRLFAEQHDTSLFIVLAAAVAVVLGRHTGLRDIAIGVPMLGRTDPDLEDVVGMFINMVVLRVDLGDDLRFDELLARVADASLDLYDHQEVPFEQVVDRVRPSREAGRNPLFQVSLQVLGAANSPSAFALPGLAVEWLEPVTTSATFDLNINYFELSDGMRVHLSYPADVFDRWRVDSFLRHVDQVLRSVLKDSRQPVSGMGILTDAELDRVLSASDERAYVVDPEGNLLPRGVPGELLLGGAEEWIRHVLDKAELAPANFVADPFRENAAVYRGGDRAIWSSDWELAVIHETETPETTPTQTAPVAAVAEATTPTETALVEIFETVLGGRQIDLEANFFELGGNSLDASRVISRIKKTFGVKASVRLLYGDNTVRAIAGAVDELKA